MASVEGPSHLHLGSTKLHEILFFFSLPFLSFSPPLLFLSSKKKTLDTPKKLLESQQTPLSHMGVSVSSYVFWSCCDFTIILCLVRADEV